MQLFQILFGPNYRILLLLGLFLMNSMFTYVKSRLYALHCIIYRYFIVESVGFLDT